MTNVYSYEGSVGTSATAPLLILTPRYPYIYIQNYSGNALWVTTDGATSASTGSPPDKQYLVPANTSTLVPNDMPLWTQTATVLGSGTEEGTGPETGTPYEISLLGTSLYANKTNPGTYLSFIGSAASTTFVAYGAG
jgi:hypothetical protein